MGDPNNAVPRDARGEPQDDSIKASERNGADKLRFAMCTVMLRREEELKAALAGTEDVDKYLARMGAWWSWGDALCLRFLPDIIARPIQVYAWSTKTKVVYEAGLHLPQDCSKHRNPVIVLWHKGGMHYDLVSRHWLEPRQ